MREAPKLSARKSSDQRAWGRAACGIGVRVPRARLRPRRRFTDSVVGKTVPRTVFRSSSILPVEPIELLVVHDHALALEQHADPAIAEPAPLSGDLLHLIADLGARHWARPMYGWLPRGKRLVMFDNWSGAAMYSASDLR